VRDVKALVYNALKSDATLLSALGGDATKVQFSFPNDFNALPVVTYREDDQAADEYLDDAATADRSVIQIDTWTVNTSTSTIAKAVDSVMAGLMFHREFSSDVPNQDATIFHRVARYTRLFSATDF